jgi:sarcosine oxidase, subunit gamma
MSVLRRSPVHDQLALLEPTWVELEGMQVAAQLGRELGTLKARIADVSCLKRMGVKGPGAAAWLEAQQLADLPGVNQWLRTSDGLWLARLGRSEFLLEDALGGRRVETLRGLVPLPDGVYPVLRQDAAFALEGEGVPRLLQETCSVDFAAFTPEEPRVVLTQLAGVSVIVFWEPHGNARRYRVYTDASLGPYLFSTLVSLAKAHGGGASGFYELFPDAAAQLGSKQRGAESERT